MVLDLVEAGFDVIGVGHDIAVWVCDPKVMHTDEYILPHCAKFALELGAMKLREVGHKNTKKEFMPN
jgi:hypothetical protein